MNWIRMFAWAGLGLTACAQTVTQGTPSMKKEIAMTQENEAAKRARLNLRPAKWPLKFKKHSFEAHCFDTLWCSVWYAGLDQGDDRPTPPSSKYGSGYRENWSGGHVGIHNFPDPAAVSWRSKDGTEHKAEIDMAAIFRDELILHNVARDQISDLPDGEYDADPSILLEVNDRSIRVYMRALVPTRQLQVPGNIYSNGRDDLILVKSYSY